MTGRDHRIRLLAEQIEVSVYLSDIDETFVLEQVDPVTGQPSTINVLPENVEQLASRLRFALKRWKATT